MKQHVINCPYCHKPYDLVLTPDRKGEGLAHCTQCMNKFQIIWDITVKNDIKVFRLENIHTNNDIRISPFSGNKYAESKRENLDKNRKIKCNKNG